MTGQVDQMQLKSVRQPLHQRREYATVQCPAMNQHERRAAAYDFDMHTVIVADMRRRVL
jgi:hypothetical protein